MTCAARVAASQLPVFPLSPTSEQADCMWEQQLDSFLRLSKREELSLPHPFPDFFSSTFHPLLSQSRPPPCPTCCCHYPKLMVGGPGTYQPGREHRGRWAGRMGGKWAGKRHCLLLPLAEPGSEWSPTRMSRSDSRASSSASVPAPGAARDRDSSGQ